MSEAVPFTDAEAARVAEAVRVVLGKPTKPCISVWRFDDAPTEYQLLSTNGGDEDWVAFIPESLAGLHIGWLEEGYQFGCCDVSEYDVSGGKIRIGSHA